MPTSVSIVTCVRDDVRVVDALRSVSAQTCSVELVLVDGCSGVATRRALAKHSSMIDRFVSRVPRGAFDAMNAGISVSSGDVVGILNADDYYVHPGVLSLVLRAFTATSTGIVYGNIVLVGSDGRRVRRWRPGPCRPAALRWGWSPPHPAVFVHRGLSALRSLQYFLSHCCRL